MEEDVIYSEGEPFEGYLYPNNTWDSDESTYEEDYSEKLYSTLCCKTLPFNLVIITFALIKKQ